jgi:hypothetical protein
MLRCRNIDLTDLLVGVGISSSKRSGSSALRGELGARQNLWIVCVAPLRLGGLRGKKSTPSIGWEVLVRSRRLAIGSCMEHGQHLEQAKRQQYASFLNDGML